MPKIEQPFYNGQWNYVDGGPEEASLEDIRKKVNLAPYLFSTVAEAEVAEYSEPETVAIKETKHLYIYDATSTAIRDGLFILNTGGSGRLVSILLQPIIKEAYIRGTGNTSATSALKIQNKDGVDIAIFRDDKRAFFPAGTVTTPSISFINDTDTGFYSTGSNIMGVLTAGQLSFVFKNQSFDAAATNGGSLRNVNASSTTPTLSPSRMDADTGVGWAAADQLSLIAGGIEGQRTATNGVSNINSVRNKSTPVNAATYTVLSTDHTVAIEHTPTAPVTVILPPLSTAWDVATNTGQVVIIKDSGGAALTNNITVTSDAGDGLSIDGSESFTIDIDYQCLTLQAVSATKWAVIY